jgi:hypothetical protein
MSGPSDFVPTILEPMVRERRVGFHLVRGAWKDVGSPELWLDAHLFLIRAMETGALLPHWRRRVASTNQRIANEIWVSKASIQSKPLLLRTKASHWAGPCYFSGENPPQSLGPCAVLYGEGSEDGLSNGIGMGGKWVNASSRVELDTG